MDALIGAHDPRVLLANHVAGGAVTRVDELATAFPHRNAGVMFVVVTVWEDRTKDEEMIAATRACCAALEPFMGGYDNIEFDRRKGTENHGPAYQRLSHIKRSAATAGIRAVIAYASHGQPRGPNPAVTQRQAPPRP